MGLREQLYPGATKPGTAANTAPYSSYRINKAKADIRVAANKIQGSIGKRDLLLDQKADSEADKLKAEKEIGTFDLVQILLDKTSAYARAQAKGQIEDTVSDALNVVFGGAHRFIIQLETRSNRPEVDYFLDNGETITQLVKPDYDNGGGYVDVITTALRLAIAELEGAPGPLLMDEVGKHIDAEHSGNMAYFLKEYAKTFGRQIILITHNKKLAEVGDLNLEVTMVKGISQVSQIGGEA
jgi:DNA repair exonuclease SbcCD ATPase subunit